ncbi:MAG: hypothetical protein Q8O84_01515 [Nanoarchaeota archaeon]|nr:hypothetical protein [Nanoarchaeota archaeon]
MKKRKPTGNKFLEEILIGITLVGIAIAGFASNKKSNEDFLKNKYETDSIYQAKTDLLEKSYMTQTNSLENSYASQKDSLERWYVTKNLENRQKYIIKY